MEEWTLFTNNEYWDQIMQQLREDFCQKARLDEYNLWFGGLKFIGTNGTSITVDVPSIFFKNQLIKRGYVELLQRKINEVLQKEMFLEMKLRKDLLTYRRLK